MAIIVTPGQLSRRAEFYHQLAQLTAAGLGIPQSIEQLRKHPTDRSYREPLEILKTELARGYTFSEALRRTPDWLPEFDIALVDAGELSGNLDKSFRALGEYYEDRAQMARQLITDMLYPAFLFHFAVFIIPFARAFSSGNWFAYLLQTLGILLPIYFVVALALFVLQSKHGEGWRSLIERILHPIPILGSARRDLALSRLAMALEALIRAGVTVVEAWELAGKVSGSSALRRTINAWKHKVEGGQTLAEAVFASGKFPEMFANQYASGEMSGKLDEVLGRLHKYYQESGQRKMRALARWTPVLVYLIVALLIAIHIVRFWMNYFQQIRDAGGF